MRNGLTLLLSVVLLSSCAPKLSTNLTSAPPPVNRIDPNGEVTVVGPADPMPRGAEVLGQFRIGYDGSKDNCSYDEVVAQARQEARKIGGNIVKITDHYLPSQHNGSCHRIHIVVALKQKPVEKDSIPAPVKVPVTGNMYRSALPYIISSDITSLEAPKWRVAFDAGYSRRMAELADGLNSYEREQANAMRNAYMFGLDVQYYPRETVGFGLKGEAIFAGKEVLTDETFYVGPSVVFRGFDNNKRNASYIGLSAGYFNYTARILNTYSMFSNDRVSKSWGGLGSVVELGYDIRLGRGNTFFGIKISAFLGSFEVDGTSSSVSGPNKRESLTALRAGAGFRF